MFLIPRDLIICCIIEGYNELPLQRNNIAHLWLFVIRVFTVHDTADSSFLKENNCHVMDNQLPTELPVKLQISKKLYLKIALILKPQL